jgi:trigger factor
VASGSKQPPLEKLIDGAWRDAIKQESLEPISQPDLSSGFDGLLESFNPGDELTFTLEADVAPTPKLKSTKGPEGGIRSRCLTTLRGSTA